MLGRKEAEEMGERKVVEKGGREEGGEVRGEEAFHSGCHISRHTEWL